MGKGLVTTERTIVQRTERSMAAIRALLRSDPRLRSYNTRRGYEHDLEKFLRWRQGNPMATKLDVESYASRLLEQGQSPNTVNRSLAAIRWLARKMSDLAFEDETMDREQREFWMRHGDRVARKVRNVRGQRGQRGRDISEGEFRALLKVCMADDSPAGLRDAAMLAVAWQTGLRRSELGWIPAKRTRHGKRRERGLLLEDYRPSGNGSADLQIRSAKGDKDRMVPLRNGAVAYIKEWLELRGSEPGPLFCAIRKDGTLLHGQGLSGEALAQILAKRIEVAGISEHMTWHDFRRTCATQEIPKQSVTVVQKLLGHESASTTLAYDRSDYNAVCELSRERHVPYIRQAAAV